MPLTDIGNGQKLFEIGDAVESATKIMGLADLANKLKKAPFDQAKAQADAIVAAQDASPDALRARLLEQQGKAAAVWGAEKRARADFTLKTFGSMGDIAGQHGAEAAQEYLNQSAAAGAVPAGSRISESKTVKGTFAMTIPRRDGSFTTIPLDPNRMATAKERASIANQYREQWGVIGKTFTEVSDPYRNFKSSIGLGTGIGDHNALFSAQKMLDKANQVGQGQSEEFSKHLAGLLGQFQLAIDKSSDPNSPLFGKGDNKLRREIEKAFDQVYANAEHDTLVSAGFFSRLADKNTDDPEGVMPTYGGIGYKQGKGEAPVDHFAAGSKPKKTDAEGNEIKPAALPVPPRRQAPAPSEAGIGRLSKEAPAVKATEPAPKTMSLDDILGSQLFTPGGK
jgi:hypothetical protein